ncbi:FAD-binding domain [Nakamurella multipartita]|uniref:Monooxygenase FAD-binding n=1 Tax=Nakamurella multipartita (strain ATCC 700099 / DSM 44233 / CIP 104796 / JCM 9543 / NBRC 105858 / Y-104) TaxID=479431 RepID=C8X640_NAKMY|nr:FAD-binding domain [Nakamurella multipartita]ACV76811.1 monooxygenase FAD-binding [Nakamurella multipartita DSM 44233]
MKVLIVGAGIAGPTLAYWLLRAGHQPTLVERAPELRHGGYVIDFWGAGFEVAERMGIAEELRGRGYRFRQVRVVDRRGHRFASFRPASIVGPMDRYVSIARSELARVIYDSLDGAVELILGDTVRTLCDESDRVRVEFGSGDVRHFDLVVGADGLHSRVRRLAFGADAQFEKYLGIVFAAFQAQGYRPRDELVAMMHAEIGFQAVRLSLRQDMTLFLFTVRHLGAVPTDDRTAQQDLLRAKLAGKGWETSAMLELMPQSQSFYFDSASQIRMPEWSRGRVVLVGDAAAGPSFLAGQGSALAMVESYTLAAELARTADHREAFGRYQARLAPLLRSKQDAAQGLGLAFAPASGVQLLVRNAAMIAMGLPRVAGLVMGRSFHDSVELPEFAAA